MTTRRLRGGKTKRRKSNKQLSEAKTIKLLKELKKCRKPCLKLARGSKKRKNCFKKQCKTVVNKMVKIVLKKKRKTRKHKGCQRYNRRMRGGDGKGACPLVGAPWTAGGAPNSGYYYPLARDGIGVGGTPPYPGNNSPSPQHGGGLWQQLITNPYRQITGGLANSRNIYDGQAVNPSSNPEIQNQVVPQSYNLES